jgi:hypothetical protein
VNDYFYYFHKSDAPVISKEVIEELRTGPNCGSESPTRTDTNSPCLLVDRVEESVVGTAIISNIRQGWN